MQRIIKLAATAVLLTAGTAAFAQSTGKSSSGGTMPADEMPNAGTKDRTVSAHDRTVQSNNMPTNPGSSGSKAIAKTGKPKTKK